MDNDLKLPNLTNKISILKEYFNFYGKNSEVEKLDNLQKKLNKKEYKIGVIGNMSAGKTALINALFGKEILPSLNEATTDSATYVYSQNEDKKAIIYQGDNKTELDKDNLRELLKYALKDESLEGPDVDKYKNVNKIDLYYPFKKIQSNSDEDLNVILIDTPGANNTSTSGAKHKEIASAVINDVDMIFAIFGIDQLDATLSGEIWNSIKERVEKDKNFIVYFVLNKIDKAFKETFKDEKDFTKENWYKKEKKAEETLKKAIDSHSIKKYSIFLISSLFTLYIRNENIGRLEKRELKYLEEDIRQIFPENAEEKMLDYIGMEKFENAINDYINKNAKKNLLLSIDGQINKLIQDEQNELERRGQVLKKPKEEAEINLEKVSEFLKKDAIELENKMKSASSKLKEDAQKEIEKLIYERIQKDFQSKKDEIAYRSLKFIKSYLDSFSYKDAKTSVDKLSFESIKKGFPDDIFKKGFFKFDSKKKMEETITQNIAEETNKYMIEKVNDCKLSYLNIKSDIKNFYHEFDLESTKLFFKYKDSLEDKINGKLEIKKDQIQMPIVQVSVIENYTIEIPKSKLAYDHEAARYKSDYFVWYKPSTWYLKDTKVKDEKFHLVLNPDKTYKNIEDSIKNFIQSFNEEEINSHKNKIEKHLEIFEDMFQNFRHKLDSEIQGLTRDLKRQEESLEKFNKQELKFKEATEDKINGIQ